MADGLPLGKGSSIWFWTLWGIDAVVAGIALFFFFIGIADGSVSSFNIGIWTLLLLGLAIVVGGSLAARAAGYRGLAIALLVALAVPSVLLGLFFLALIVLAPDWR